jgi:poly(3-hydroxybutyrate) depolymerase
LPFFDALIAELRLHYPVDPTHIHFVGHSNGASFATFLLAHRSSVIASGAVQSGAHLPVGELQSDNPPSLLLMWGEKDEFSPTSEGVVDTIAKDYRAAGFVVEPVIFSGGHHAWGGPAYKAEERVLDFFRAHAMDSRTAR